jgi:hypothetical protein
MHSVKNIFKVLGTLLMLVSFHNVHAAVMGVVTSVTGTVHVDNVISKQLNFLDISAKKISVSSDAVITIFLFDGVKEYTLSGPGVYEVRGPLIVKTSGSKAILVQEKNPAYGNIGVKLKDGLVQAGVIVRSKKTFRDAPAFDDTIDASMPRFAWGKREHSGAYSFSLTAENDKVLYQTELEEETFSLPAEVRLAPSSNYQWILRWRNRSGLMRVATTQFSTLTTETANLMNTLKPNADATSTSKVIYGLWLQSIGALALSDSYLTQ